MKPTPLKSFDAAREEPSASSPGSTPASIRRSMFRRAVRGVGWLSASPVQWFGHRSVRRGATFIGDLVNRIRTPAQRDLGFKTAERGAFDLHATAWRLGLTVAELRKRLDGRRRQTALAAYTMAALGVVFFSAWLLKVLHTPTASGRMLLAFDFLPLCLLFVLLAFYQALVNFQIRVGRAASWREYLTTEDDFWPRI
jgi:hypothetical protein